MKSLTSLFRATPLAFLLFPGFASAQTPALRWAFDEGKGTPSSSIWISGGNLEIECPGSGYTTFLPTGGAGPATPGVFNGAANTFGDWNSASRITSAKSPLVTDVELPQFTLTMWVKPTEPIENQRYARMFALTQAEEERSKSSLFVAIHESSNLEVCLNGIGNLMKLPEGALATREWTFIAIVYDGFATNPYHCTDMLKAVGAETSAALFLGGTETPAKLVTKYAFTSGEAGNYQKSPGPLEINGLVVSLGCSIARPDLSFLGLIDDVRIYGGLLKSAQIEAVRQAALAAP